MFDLFEALFYNLMKIAISAIIKKEAFPSYTLLSVTVKHTGIHPNHA